MAVMINRIFPAPKFRRGHYIGLQMSGKLDGSINVSAPSVIMSDVVNNQSMVYLQ